MLKIDENDASTLELYSFMMLNQRTLFIAYDWRAPRTLRYRARGGKCEQGYERFFLVQDITAMKGTLKR